MNLRHQLTLSSLITLLCANGAFAHPEVFSNFSFDQAKQQAQKEGKLLLVDFTASWCPPCRKMEASTWTSDDVKLWLKENAIAIQVDVDEDSRTSSALHVEAMPTMVLFTPQNGYNETGRQVGYMDHSELVRWLEAIKSGKSDQDVAQEQSGSNGAEVWEHIGKAHELQASGQNAGALDEYVWLWEKIDKTDPNLGPVKTSMIPTEMKALCAVYPPAKIKVGQMRDAADTAGNRADWITLNAVLGDESRTLAWFDKAKTDPKQGAVIRQNTSLLEQVLFSKSRWADAAQYLYPEPLVRLGEYYARAQDMKKPRPDTEVAKDFDPFPSMVLLLYGAFVGSGRDAEAQKIADECLRLDDTPTMREGLNNMARGMRQARTAQTKPGGKAL